MNGLSPTAVRNILLVAGGVLLAALLLPALGRTKSGPPCGYNLKAIQAAKLKRAQELGVTNDLVITKEQLLPYLAGSGARLRCPIGGRYTIGKLNESPGCSHPEHAQIQVPTE